MNIIISQPRYLPALNYVNRLCCADSFMVFDIIQRQPREPHNRNKLLCNGEPKWLTIPINASNRALIYDMKVAGIDWIQQHKDTIRNYYLHAPYFEKEYIDLYFQGIDDVLMTSDFDFTTSIMQTFSNLGELLDFKPRLIKSSDINNDTIEQALGPDKLMALCQKAGANLYISGPAGRGYRVIDAFQGSGVDVLFHDYTHPIYDQVNTSEFIPYMGFFDALFNLGRDQLIELIKQPMHLIA